MQITASAAILDQLGAENRRVLSDWRATLLLRRASLALPPEARRWSQFPQRAEDVHPLLRRMERRGEIKPIPRLRHIYQVIVPYARTGQLEEDEVLMEAHPYAAVSHLSALVFHNLTDDLPKRITAVAPRAGTAGLLPLGTDATDWEGLTLVRGRMPSQVLDHPVHWTRILPERYFGIGLYRQRGYPVRVTTPERTLLDGLQDPELCGGFQNVLRAWALAQDTLRLDELIDNVERFKVHILRQRVGFIMDQLGLSHPAIERWRTHAHRGGSSKLLGSAPYAPDFSERWNLSINTPIAALREATA